MSKYYYSKHSQSALKRVVKLFSLGMILSGMLVLAYVFFPLVSYHIYFEPAFASSNIEIPIPKTTIINANVLTSLFLDATDKLQKDYTNANTWFPSFQKKYSHYSIPSYVLSIPKLKIKDARVATTDTDLSKHLIHYEGTALSPDKGNAVIFGHSTLPQLFNSLDYKTIFANIHTLKIEDELLVTIENVTYSYKVFSINIVDPENTSVFAQDLDDSYLTLVTCTPPGTTWKRLIIKSRLKKLS